MREKTKSIQQVKESMQNLKGNNLKISVNKGRKKIVKYDGKIINLYPSVFTLKIFNDKNIDFLSCSYNDVICGDIKFKIC